MTTLSKILIGILIGVAGIGWLLYGIQGCQNKKTVQTLTAQLKACQNAPCKVVTTVIHDTIHDTLWRTPKVVTKTVTISDTVEKVKWCYINYTDTYKFGSGDSTGSFLIKIHDHDCIPQYQISNMIYPVIHKSIIKTVLHDTSIYKPVTHYGFLVGASVNNFKSFPSFQAGVFLSLGDKVIIEPGVLYNPIDGHAYFNAILGVNLDKHK